MNSFLKRQITAQEARSIIKRRLDEREQRFLDTIEATVFSNPESPYLPLLNSARCTLGDISSLVRSRGVENALGELRDNGVYMTFEEFKGRVPVKRNGLEFTVRPEDFDNPRLSNFFTTSTSGTSGRGVQVVVSLDNVSNKALYDVLQYDLIGMSNAPLLMWFPAFPGLLGPLFLLRSARAGLETAQIFDPCTATVGRFPRAKQAVIRKTFLKILRANGFDFPDPMPVPLDQPETIARQIHKVVKDRGRCMFRTYMSMCSRVGLAAMRLGLDLSGSVFFGGGEPVTPAKVRPILECGARFYPTYHLTEFGFMGAGCLNPSSCNDIHVFLDSGAIIQGERSIPDTDLQVGAFYMTAIQPGAPKVMLNVESDDYGVLEHRDCGCPFHDLGYTLHVRDIFSFCKLTGLGVTLVGNDALKILEEELPRRFGGSLLDYQLGEEELEDGQTVINLYVSPRVSLDDPAEVRSFFLETLAGGRFGNPFAASQWDKSGAFRVLHSEPVRGKGGKLMPLHLQSRLAPGR